MPTRLRIILLVLWLCVPALALPGLPPATELYAQARVLSSPREARVKLAAMRRIPLVEWLLKTVDEWTGLRPERDLLTWWEGTVVTGLVRQGEVSPFNLIYRLGEGAAQYESLSLELRNLGAALDSYKLAHDGKLPATLQELVPEYVTALPKFPGVTFVLETEKGLWRVRAEFAPDSPLAAQGKPPVNSEQGGLDSELIVHPESVGFVLALGCSSPDEAGRVLRRLDAAWEELSAAGEGRWQLKLDETVTLHLALGPGWLLATDDERLVAPCLQALLGQGPTLTSNPRFAFQCRILPVSEDFFAFLDTQEVAAHSPDLPVEARAALVPFHSLGLTYQGGADELNLRAFLEVRASALSKLQEPVDLGDMAGWMPWESSGFLATDLSQLYRLLQGAAEVDPSIGVMLTEWVGWIEKTLDVQLPQEVLLHGSARLLTTSERIDWLASLASVFEGFVARAVPEPEASPGASPTPEPMLAVLPIMSAVQVDSAPVQEALYQGLVKSLGAQPRNYRVAEARVETSNDGRLAVARQGGVLLAAGGGTSRLLDRSLETMLGQRKSIAALDSFRRFQEKQRGGQLLLAHSKVDWLYSLLKGFLLLLGSDFRSEATSLGRWRDAYGALLLEPEGLRFTGTLYATEQIP